MLELDDDRKNLIKEIIDDGVMEINGHKYSIMKFNHKTRLIILEFLHKMEAGKAMIGGADWQFIEKELCQRITFDEMQISKLPDHWEGEHAEDYITFMTMALQVVAYPFLTGKRTS